MKLYAGRFRSRKTMKRALGMSGDKAGNFSNRYYTGPVKTDGLGNRFVNFIKEGRLTSKRLSAGRGR